MNFEKLMDALAEGDDEIEIHIKHKAKDEDECSECDKDFCPLDDYDEYYGDEQDEDAKDDEETEDLSLNELEDALKGDIEEVYKEVLETEGKEAADKLLDLSIQQTLIYMALQERIPIRTEDVEKYNALVKGAHSKWYAEAMYLIHSNVLNVTGERIKNKIKDK